MTISIPDEIAEELGRSPAVVERRVLEAVALVGYLAGQFSAGYVGRMLGISLWEAEHFLDRHTARQPYTVGMLRQDRDTLGVPKGQ